MADAVGFEGANEVYAAPPGREDEVHDLQVYEGADHTASCWRLTAEELAEVNRTGVVWVRIMGHSVVPFYVSGHALVLIDGQPSRAEPVIPRAPR